MEVYDFKKECQRKREDVEFLPISYSSRSIADVDDFPPTKSNVKNVGKQRTAMRTSSSGDILLQIQNSNKPTPNNQMEFDVAPMAPKHPANNYRLLRHSNSESCIGQNANEKSRGCYRSPHAYLLVRKYHPSGPDFLSTLSDELLLNIFQYLPKSNLIRCSKVNRRFNRLAKDETLWKRLDLGLKRLDESTLHRLINRGIQSIRLSKAQVDLTNFDYVRTNLSRLQYLDLGMLITTGCHVICGVLYRCRQLLALSLEGCDLDDETCMYISRNVNLKFLNLTLCRGLTANGLTNIMRGCKHLEELNLSWTSMDKESVELACTLLPTTLVKLNMAGCRFGSMEDDDIANLTDRCPKLVELDISDCTDLTGRTLQYISENFCHLQSLSCSRCYAVEPNSYTLYCKGLKELNIFGTIKEESMPVLKRALVNVEINNSVFSTIARPTVGIRRTSIWEQRVRDA